MIRILKFGGSSVGSPDRIQRVARIIREFKKEYPQDHLVVVVSAMGDTTDDLISLAKKVSAKAQHSDYRREMDMLLSAGERISMALLSMALQDLDIPSKSFTGSQSGIITDTVHGEAKISEIRPQRIQEELKKGNLCIVAGFQGVSREKEITTLGRGGSDTSAVALGVVLDADEIFIFTDVDGVFPVDPRKSETPLKPLEKISWPRAIELAYRGAQVLHPRCVELAWKFKKKLCVANSFIDNPDNYFEKIRNKKLFKGTWVMGLEDKEILNVAFQQNCNVFETEFASEALVAENQMSLLKQGIRVLKWKIDWNSPTSIRTQICVDGDQAKRLLQGSSRPWKQVSASILRVSLLGTDPSNISELLAGLEKAKNQGFKGEIKMIESSGTVVEMWIDETQNVDTLQRLFSSFQALY
jgi:aspartate kinase